MSTLTRPLNDRIVAGPEETAQARHLLEAVPADATAEVVLRAPSRETVTIPTELAQLIKSVVTMVAEGRTVTVGSLPEVLTTTVAAAQLGVSRPTLLKMVKEGQIPGHKIGSHTRLRTEDVMRFRRERLMRQRAALQELIGLEDELEDSADEPV